MGDQISWELQPRPSFADGTVIVPGITAKHISGRVSFHAITIEEDVIKSVEEISETEYDRLDEEFNRLASQA